MRINGYRVRPDWDNILVIVDAVESEGQPMSDMILIAVSFASGVAWGISVAILAAAMLGDRDAGTDLPDAGIKRTRTCPECGESTFTFERCHLCGDVPWRDDDG